MTRVEVDMISESPKATQNEQELGGFQKGKVVTFFQKKEEQMLAGCGENLTNVSSTNLIRLSKWFFVFLLFPK